MTSLICAMTDSECRWALAHLERVPVGLPFVSRWAATARIRIRAALWLREVVREAADDSWSEFHLGASRYSGKSKEAA